jgi:hypothetical protein
MPRHSATIFEGITPAAFVMTPLGLFIEDPSIKQDVIVVPMDAAHEMVFRRCDAVEGIKSPVFQLSGVQPVRSPMPHPPAEARGVLWSPQEALARILTVDPFGSEERQGSVGPQAPAALSGSRHEA